METNRTERHIELELRSEEIQEILTRVPHWMIRWGSLIVFFIMIFLIYLSYAISYPDIVSTQVTITTNVPPQKLIAKTSGRIQALLVGNQSNVESQTPMAVIENSANYKDIFLLKSIMDTIDPEKQYFPFEKLQVSELGEIEEAYSAFQKEYTANDLNIRFQPYKVDGVAQTYEARQLRDRLKLLEAQKSINESEIQIESKDLERYEVLFKKGIISPQEIEKQRLVILQSQRNYKSLLSSLSELKSALNGINHDSKNTKINESKQNINLKHSSIQAFHALKNAIRNWELKYVMRAAINGKATFLQIWSENQYVKAGENIFAVIPTNQNKYIGKALAASKNAGKIRVGQKVIVKLANFPSSEFGVINGKITSISLTPDKNGNLLITIALPKILISSYGKKIPFSQEMTGTANIVTQDLRLIQRIFHQFRNIFNR